jgi:hypothetical protein
MASRLFLLLPAGAQVTKDAPAKAGALAICAAIGGAGGVFIKACVGAKHLSYGDAWAVGSAAGIAVGVIYLLV